MQKNFVHIPCFVYMSATSADAGKMIGQGLVYDKPSGKYVRRRFTSDTRGSKTVHASLKHMSGLVHLWKQHHE